MHPDKINRIKELATEFRNGIENSDRKLLGDTFASFPSGSCGDASPLLGAYLIDAGISKLMGISGFRGERSHVWLESGPLFIDITADQFDDFDLPVFVSRDASWHDLFGRREETVADFRDYDPVTVSRLSGFYTEIRRNIEPL